ncbi:uncharacterized protein [Cherax quadricarinatus]
MAEGHAEDAPLLGGSDSLSPADCSPDRQPGVGGSPTVWPAPTSTHIAVSEVPQPWPPDVQVPHAWPPDAWMRGPPHRDTLHVPDQGDSPKLVRSQSSMDSGCECDGGDGDAGGPHDAATHQAAADARHQPPGDANPTAGFSPLSPSQPGGSGPPTPGPSTQVVVLVTPTAHNTYAHVPDIEMGRGGCGNNQSCVCDIGVGAAEGSRYERAHTDPHTKVTFMLEEDDDDDEYEQDGCGVVAGMNAIETASYSGSEPGEDFKEQLRHHAVLGFPRVPSYSRTGVLSASSSTASMPMCRICHHPQGDGLDTLISPCRCAGTMQFIHQGCLNKWLEVKRCKKAPVCELCNYQFHRHKKFRLHHWQLPSCSRADKILHSIFLVCLIIMAACATITIICFKQVIFCCCCCCYFSCFYILNFIYFYISIFHF